MASLINQKAVKVGLIVFDVDGVLTRGDIVYSAESEWKVFFVPDGLAFHLAREGGIKIALLSGRTSEAVKRRALELGVELHVEGVTDKGAALKELIDSNGFKPEDVCYVGDDLPDIPAMRMVGFPVAVLNAAAEVKDAAAWTTTRRGGDGAAREVVECILKAKGIWQQVIRTYVGNSETI